MNSRWFYIDGALSELRGSESSIREQVRELVAAHSRVKPARRPERVSVEAYARAASHHRRRG